MFYMRVEGVVTVLDEETGTLAQSSVCQEVQVEAPMTDEVLAPLSSSMGILAP